MFRSFVKCYFKQTVLICKSYKPTISLQMNKVNTIQTETKTLCHFNITIDNFMAPNHPKKAKTQAKKQL